MPTTENRGYTYPDAGSDPRLVYAQVQQLAEDVDADVDTVAGAAVTDHGGLAGLADDDHTQYLRADGTRALTGPLSFADQQLRRPVLRDYAQVLNTVASSGATRTLDHEVADVHDVTLSQNCTFTLSNWPASGVFGGFTIVLRTGGYTPTFTGLDFWINQPDTWVDGVYLITIWSVDGGTTTTAVVAGPRVAA